jgi:broad specificity phosphatase PhoE
MIRSVIFLARHGETDWNASGRMQGQTDVPLNGVGRAQARGLAGRLRGEGLRAICSSDLSRARETAEIVAAELGLAVSYVDPAFRERAFGIFEGLTHAECKTRHPTEWARYDADPAALPLGLEPIDQVTARMLAGLRRAGGGMPPPALVVSHGRAIRSLLDRITGLPVGPLANGAVYRVIVEEGVPVDAAPLASATG